MKLRHFLLAAGLFGSAALVIFGEPMPPAEITEAVERPSQLVVSPALEGSAATSTVEILSVMPRNDLFASEQRKSPRDIFRSRSWTPTPELTGEGRAKPLAPALPFIYVGRQAEGQGWAVFLAQDSTTLIVRHGDVLNEKYRVEKIEPPFMTLVYLPLNEEQTLAIE